MAAGKANFEVYKGDTFRKSLTITSPSGTPVNLSGSTITGNAGAQPFSCSIVNASQGKFKIELSPSQTQELVEGVNVYGVQITYADASVQTILTGNLVVLKEIV